MFWEVFGAHAGIWQAAEDDATTDAVITNLTLIMSSYTHKNDKTKNTSHTYTALLSKELWQCVIHHKAMQDTDYCWRNIWCTRTS